MHSDKEFVNVLEVNIRKRRAMEKLISDRGSNEVSVKARNILPALFIEGWQSEPYHQHQNIAERRYAQVKSQTNVVLNQSGAPAFAWMLAIMFVCMLLNSLACYSLGGSNPLQVYSGQQTDISQLLKFAFWEKVYYSAFDPKYPSESTEKVGHFVGFADSVGDTMTFKILTEDNKVIFRSNVRTAEDKKTQNKHADPPEEKKFIRSRSEVDNTGDTVKRMPGFDQRI